MEDDGSLEQGVDFFGCRSCRHFLLLAVGRLQVQVHGPYSWLHLRQERSFEVFNVHPERGSHDILLTNLIGTGSFGDVLCDWLPLDPVPIPISSRRKRSHHARSNLAGESESMRQSITHPSESTRSSRFYPAGALRDPESLLTSADDAQDILSLSSGKSPAAM